MATADDPVAAFRLEIRAWLEENLVGTFAEARGRGGPGRDHEAFALRRSWERRMAAAGWTCIGWPAEHGGRGATIGQQVAFHEEYALADAPARVGHIGEELLGPTLIALGTPGQRRRFLPPIRRAEELWCQGYSEPGAGSDLAAVSTRAERREGPGGPHWRIHGQKVWTSHAREADWCFVLARTDPGSTRRDGLGFLLVPLRQEGVEVRPITQLTGTSEFNEVFFDGARAEPDHIVGAPGEGWRVAMATLGFERGVSTLGRQVGYERELRALVDLARTDGAARDPLLRDRLIRAWIDVRAMRATALRTMAGLADGVPGPEASIAKIHWARWHRRLGELAMEAAGPGGALASGPPYELDRWQRLFLFSRADTIYAGTDEVQRDIIAERVLGLPRDRRS